jgi:hypothetical protein
MLMSFAIATLSFGLPFLALPGADAVVKFSLLLALVWIALTIFAFVKYGLRALWCLLGVPFVSYWFVVVYSIASACQLAAAKARSTCLNVDVAATDNVVEVVDADNVQTSALLCAGRRVPNEAKHPHNSIELLA